MSNVSRIAEVQLAYSIATLKQILRNVNNPMLSKEKRAPNAAAAFIMKSLREMDSGFGIWSALLKLDCTWDFHSRDDLIRKKLRIDSVSLKQLKEQLEVYTERLEERFTWNGRDCYGVGYHPNRRCWQVSCYSDVEESGWCFELFTT